MLTEEYFREAAREYLLTDGATLESALTILVEVSLRLRAEARGGQDNGQDNGLSPETAANSQAKVPKLPTSTPVKTPAALDLSPQGDDPNMQPRSPVWSPTFYPDTPFIPTYEVDSFESAIRSGLVPVKGPYGIVGHHHGDHHGDDNDPDSYPRSGWNSPQVMARPASPGPASVYYESTGSITPASPTREVLPADNLRSCRDNSLRLYNLEAHTQAVLDNVVFDYLMTHPEFTIDKINCSQVRAKRYGNFPRNVMAVHWASYCTRTYRTDLAESYCLEQKCQCRGSDVVIPICDREHWRFLVELTNGNFVYMRASCVGSFSKDGYIEAYLAKDPRELIASMTAAEYDDYDSFTMEIFEASFLE